MIIHLQSKTAGKTMDGEMENYRGWTDGWMDGWMDGWIGGTTDGLGG